jgi:hypothetical protein
LVNSTDKFIVMLSYPFYYFLVPVRSKMPSSSSYSRILSVYVSPLVCETKFHTHKKQYDKL